MSVFAAATAHRSSRCRKAIPDGSTAVSGGLLARGLVGCSIPGPSGYQRFRSVESKDKCPLFKPEEDASRIEARYRTVKLLRAAFAEWIAEHRQRIKNEKNARY